jgi:hypothetical protein
MIGFDAIRSVRKVVAQGRPAMSAEDPARFAAARWAKRLAKRTGWTFTFSQG